jgi:hypothetical protein
MVFVMVFATTKVEQVDINDPWASRMCTSSTVLSARIFGMDSVDKTGIGAVCP